MCSLDMKGNRKVLLHEEHVQDQNLQRIDIRYRQPPPVGFIVDGAVAEALPLAFSNVEDASSLGVATAMSPGGTDILVVRRNRPHAMPEAVTDSQPVEDLLHLGVRQFVALSQRLLLAPGSDDLAQLGLMDESLTIAIMPENGCRRLLPAAAAVAEEHDLTQSVALDDLDTTTDSTLRTELMAARMHGACMILIEACTLRTDVTSRKGEQAMASMLLALPDAISPLASCQCMQAELAGGSS